MLILVYLIAWTPYAIVTLIGQFGPENEPLSPAATAIPAYFAKTAVVLDPLVYGFSHPHFRSSLKHYLSNVLANQSLSHISVQAHKSVTIGAPPVNSTYQSRGMTIYPSGPATSEHHFYLNGAINNNKRRMLRTFRDLSQENEAPHRSNRLSESGILELTQNCAALITVPLEQPQRTSLSSPTLLNSQGNASPPAETRMSQSVVAVQHWRCRTSRSSVESRNDCTLQPN